jgi:phosphatidylglycerophosphate synthase
MTPQPHVSSGLTRQTAVYVVLGAVCVTGIGLAFVRLVPFTLGFLAGALVPYCTVCLIAVARIAESHPFGRFGAANVLTLIRLVICSLIGGLALELAIHETPPRDGVMWVFCAMAVCALVIDGLDGYAARKQNMTSAFGGRFDMEVDALQILLLCIVAIALEKAGLWIIIGGLLRYVYEVAGVFWPALQRPLPPSFRRKLVSVVKGSTLAGLLAPIIVPPFSTVVAAAALALLIYSFTVDVIWLAIDDRRARRLSS